MTKITLRTVDSGILTGAEHMALDEVIMETHQAGLAPDTFRFLQFPACVLVGRHQNTGIEVNLGYCRRNGIEINRRITGGGALYWGQHDLGWELYAAKKTPGIPGDVRSLYQVMCEGTARGLERLGIPAQYRPVNDIEVNGRKICGTGGTELAETFVFQCSILVDPSHEQMGSALLLSPEKMRDKRSTSFAERITSIRQELGYLPPVADIKHAIMDGLAETFQFTFASGVLNMAEKRRLEERLPFFRSEQWIHGDADRMITTHDSIVSHKAPGGLIRVAARVDAKRRRIMTLLITGDFFAYPERFIYDLESRFKNAVLAQDTVELIVAEAFSTYSPRIPGVTREDMVIVIKKAIDAVKGA